MKKKIFLIFLLALLFLCPQIHEMVEANEGELKIINVRGDGILFKEDEVHITNRNTMSIQVTCNRHVTAVKLGNVELTDYRVSGSNRIFIFPDYVLKVGANKLSFQVSGTEKKVIKANFNVNYISTFVPGTEHIDELPVNGKISVFENGVTLSFPKNTFLIDKDDRIINNQKLKFSVSTLSPDEYPSKYRTLLSKVINLEADDRKADYYTHPGSIQIKYADDVPTSSAATLTMMYNNGSGWKNIGAIINEKGKTATANFQGFGDYGVFNASRVFEDYNWARVYAEPLWAKGIMQIRDIGGGIIKERMSEMTPELGLSNPALRMDFASMIVRAFGYSPVARPVSRYSRFHDLSGLDREDTEDIETAAAYGIIEGVRVNAFAPRVPLTRSEAAVIIARVMDLPLLTDKVKVAADLKKVFSNPRDLNEIPEWARPHVLACVKSKIIQGIPISDTQVVFRATNHLTRGEAAKLVYLIMRDKKRI